MKKDRSRVGQAAPEAKEVYEILLEEMAARRSRLRKLVRLVVQEVRRRRQAETGTASHPRCRRVCRKLV